MNENQEHDEQQGFQEFRLPRMRDIPDVGLLLEQTTRLVNSYLEPLESIRLSSSMVSNYVKQKLISRPVKKMYYREQIANLLFIAIAKTVLPLDAIKQILERQRETCDTETAYNHFCSEFESTLQRIDSLDVASSQVEARALPSDDEQPLITMLQYLVIAAVHKVALEAYVYKMLACTQPHSADVS